MPTVSYQKRVSDTNVRTILQRIADLLGKNITVHSGDRDHVPSGGSRSSLHLAHRAADFHIQGLSDADGFAALRRLINQAFDASEAYELIIHGQHTATGGPHLHIGRYGNNRGGYVDFKTEGLTPASRGNYSRDRRNITNQRGANVPGTITNGVTVDARIVSPAIGVSASVGVGGQNQVADTTLIQSLLNRARRRLIEANVNFERFRPLVEDGDCGPRTKAAITIFQRDVLKFSEPDGRIDPGGRTIQALYIAAYGDINRIIPRVARVRQSPTPHNGNSSTGSGARAINLANARRLLEQPAVRAMLDTIAYSEGTRRDRGGKEYGTIVHGVVTQAPFNPQWVGKRSETLEITNFGRHPNLLVLWREDRPGERDSYSSACGRYQFLKRTWDWMAGFGLGDFSPQSQDLAAVMLMQYRGMIDPLLGGNFDRAVNNGAEEWASLPKAGGGGAYTGQRAHTLSALRTVYQNALQQYQR